ncbi:MAG: ABC-2 transporter permease [Solobacterium sp.]|nr:ABC-2 transporter permease [Solobacterium sp.]
MKGLLYKDLLLICKQHLYILLISFLFVGAGAVGKGNAGLSIYGIYFISTVVLNLHSLEENYHWRTFVDSLPVSREDYVNEKYVLSIILMGVAMALFLLLSAVFGTFSSSWGILFLMVMVYLISVSLILSTEMIFGIQGRSYLRIVLIMAVVLLGVGALNYSGLVLEQIARIRILPAVLLCAGVGLFILSNRITVAIIKKREW